MTITFAGWSSWTWASVRRIQLQAFDGGLRFQDDFFRREKTAIGSSWENRIIDLLSVNSSLHVCGKTVASFAVRSHTLECELDVVP